VPGCGYRIGDRSPTIEGVFDARAQTPISADEEAAIFGRQEGLAERSSRLSETPAVRDHIADARQIVVEGVGEQVHHSALDFGTI
jgi:hypothetical protein